MAATEKIIPPELEQLVITEVKLTGTQLGTGAYGSVEEGEIPGAKVAAKRLHAELVNLGSSEVIKRWTSNFVEECKLMSQLRHPHIVQFLGVCYLPGSPIPVLVMEKLQTNLDNLLETTPDIPLDIKVHLLTGISQGVVYLHSRSPPIAHRDLTARNILIDSGLTAKIADLGVARMVNIQPGQLAATMTRAPGNGLYMPPEAVQEERYNTSIDIFSFGVISLFTLTQSFPALLYSPTYRNHVTGKIVGRSEIERREHYVKLMKARVGEKHSLCRLTLDCLEYRSSKRPSAEEVLRRLQEVERFLPHDCEETKLEVIRREQEFRKEHDIQMRELTEEKAKFLNEFVNEMECLRSKSTKKISELEAQNSELQDIISNLMKEKAHLVSHITENDVKLKTQTSQDEESLNQGQQDDKESENEYEDDLKSENKDKGDIESENVMMTLDRREPDTAEDMKIVDIAESMVDSRESDTVSLDSQPHLLIGESRFDSEDSIKEERTDVLKKPDFSSSIISNWKRRKDIPDNVYLYGQPVSLNRKLYVSAMQSFASGVVLEYTPGSDEWTELPPPLVYNFTLGTLMGQLLVVGGASKSTGKVTDTLLSFDENEQKWTQLDFTLPQPLTVPLVIEFKGQLIVAGGDDETDTLVTDVNVYNSATSKWSTLQSLPNDARYKQVLDSTTLYLVGQQTTKTVHRTDIRILVFKSSAKSKVWNSQPEATNFHSAPVIFENYLLTVGGSVDECSPTTVIELYNHKKKKWKYVSDLPEPMASCCCIVVEKELFVLGGAGSKCVYTAELKLPAKKSLH